MPNMSYVRFENTYKDLQDCNEHLFDDDLSEREKKFRKYLIALCQEIAEQVEDEDDEDD